MCIRDRYSLERNFEDVEEQRGFRTGRICVDRIFTLRQTLEKRLAPNMDTHIVFTELTKAYDRVPLTKITENSKERRYQTFLHKSSTEIDENVATRIKI